MSILPYYASRLGFASFDRDQLALEKHVLWGWVLAASENFLEGNKFL